MGKTWEKSGKRREIRKEKKKKGCERPSRKSLDGKDQQTYK